MKDRNLAFHKVGFGLMVMTLGSPATNANVANATKAPLPGTITAINVNVGDEVKAGDAVLVLEAMKMANNIEAEKSGKIAAICVKIGQSVLEDDALFVIE